MLILQCLSHNTEQTSHMGPTWFPSTQKGNSWYKGEREKHVHVMITVVIYMHYTRSHLNWIIHNSSIALWLFTILNLGKFPNFVVILQASRSHFKSHVFILVFQFYGCTSSYKAKKVCVLGDPSRSPYPQAPSQKTTLRGFEYFLNKYFVIEEKRMLR